MAKRLVPSQRLSGLRAWTSGKRVSFSAAEKQLRLAVDTEKGSAPYCLRVLSPARSGVLADFGHRTVV